MLNEQTLIGILNSETFKRKLKSIFAIVGILFSGMFLYVSIQNYLNLPKKENLVSIGVEIMELHEYESRWLVTIEGVQFSLYKDDIEVLSDINLLSKQTKHIVIHYFPQEITLDEFTVFGLKINNKEIIFFESAVSNYSQKLFRKFLFSSGLLLVGLIYLIKLNRYN